MLRWMISIKTTTKIHFGKRLKRFNNQTEFDSTKHKLYTESCEGSGGSALGDTLKKHYKSLGLVLLCIISGLCEHLVHCLFYPIFLFWQVSTTNIEFGQRGPTLEGHVHGPGSWEDFVKIMVRLFSPCSCCVCLLWFDM